MLVTNIIWETDGLNVALPESVTVPEEYEDPDDIANYLSDKYGWLVSYFSIV